MFNATPAEENDFNEAWLSILDRNTKALKAHTHPNVLKLLNCNDEMLMAHIADIIRPLSFFSLSLSNLMILYHTQQVKSLHFANGTRRNF